MIQRMFPTSEVALFKTLFPLFRFHSGIIILIVILGMVAALAEGLGVTLLIPLLYSLDIGTGSLANDSIFLAFIDRFFAGLPANLQLSFIAGSIILLILIKAILSYGYTTACFWVQHQVTYRLQKDLFQQILDVGQSYVDHMQPGTLLQTLSGEASNTALALAFVIWMTTHACTILVLGTVLLLISWQLTLLVALSLVIITLLIRIMTTQVEGLGKEALDANIALQGRMVSTVMGLRTVHAFGREAYETTRFEQAAYAANKLNIKLHRISSLVSPVSEGLTIILIVILMLIALQVLIGLPALFTFAFILFRLYPQAQQFNFNRTRLMTMTAPVNHVINLLDRTDKPYIHSGPIHFSGLEREIRFSDVTFQYESAETPALKNISFSIPKGKTTALVGPSGAGKSTLISLIQRFYSVTEGTLYVDDQPLPLLDIPSWRRAIAVVNQDVHIFNTTVRENIAYGRLDATQEEIVMAAKQSHAHDFISELPQGYDTPIGERGTRLSGGQRQRLSIARAILRDPEILILDEATNALDSISEKLVQDAITELSRHRTAIVIAHRLSTIQQADQVIVLEDGTLLEQGTFSGLQREKGLFAKLYELQYENTP